MSLEAIVNGSQTGDLVDFLLGPLTLLNGPRTPVLAVIGILTCLWRLVFKKGRLRATTAFNVVARGDLVDCATGLRQRHEPPTRGHTRPLFKLIEVTRDQPHLLEVTPGRSWSVEAARGQSRPLVVTRVGGGDPAHYNALGRLPSRILRF